MTHRIYRRRRNDAIKHVLTRAAYVVGIIIAVAGSIGWMALAAQGGF